MNKKCLYCYQPLLASEEEDFHETCANQLFGYTKVPFIDISLQEIEELAKNMLHQSMSVTGVQKKMSLDILDVLSPRFTIMNLNAPFILKPPTSEYPFLPEIEDLTMHLAQIIGLPTAKHTLIRLKSGELAYITRRFDRERGQKYAMEDMCQLSGKLSENKYWGSMEQIGKIIRLYASFPEVELMKLYELTLFCFLTGNADMHLKNFSLLTQANGHTILAPAYDLVATALLMPNDKEELALTLNGKKRKFNGQDFDTFAQNLSLTANEITKIHSHFQEKMPKIIAFIAQSFLPETLQETFIALIQEKAKRLFKYA